MTRVSSRTQNTIRLTFAWTVVVSAILIGCSLTWSLSPLPVRIVGVVALVGGAASLGWWWITVFRVAAREQGYECTECGHIGPGVRHRK